MITGKSLFEQYRLECGMDDDDVKAARWYKDGLIDFADWILSQNSSKPIVSGAVEFEKLWMMTCIEDALIVADEQDEQWSNADTARLSVQKIRKEIPLKYLKATDR